MLSDFLPFVVAGIAAGAVYGLAGTGLVLTYKTSGIFNFAHGAVAAAAAYLFYFLNTEQGVGWVPSLLISVLGLGVAVGLLFERGASRLSQQPVALKIVATIGVVLIVQGLATIKFGANTITSPHFLPSAQDSFEVADVVITYEQVIVTCVALAAVALLYGLFRWTRTGVAMRAVVDDPDLLAMQATNPAGPRRLAWLIGTTFAALSGVLIAPMVGLDSILLTFLVVQAFGAAAIGAFGSIPLTFLGGVLIGVASALSTKYVVDVSWLSGVPASLPFVVLFVALFVIPKRKLVPLSRIESTPKPQYRAPVRMRLVVAGVVLVPLLVFPQLVGTSLPYYTEALVTAILMLSLGLLVRTSGQVSLCHATFAAVGAVAFSQLAVGAGMPWIVALVACGLVTAFVGALVAIPAIRLSGLFLALATLGFGILVQRLFYGQSWMFTEVASGRPMPKPSFAEDPKAYYYVVLAVLVLVAVAAVVIQRSRLGRMLQGVSGAPTAVSAMGLSTNVSKVIVFCVSGFIAGVAGALLGVASRLRAPQRRVLRPVVLADPARDARARAVRRAVVRARRHAPASCPPISRATTRRPGSTCSSGPLRSSSPSRAVRRRCRIACGARSIGSAAAGGHGRRPRCYGLPRRPRRGRSPLRPASTRAVPGWRSARLRCASAACSPSTA